MKRKIIMDCNSEHGDAIALILAGAIDSPLEILAVTTVVGNRSIDKDTASALNVLDIMERQDITVAKGADRPLIKSAALASEVHRESGLDGPKLPSTPSRQAVVMPVSDVIISKVMTSDTPVTVVAVGPLTDVATALIRESRIAEHIESITLMSGGTFENWTPTAEFNIQVGAEAAKHVFESGITINVFGLDLTHQVSTDDHAIEHFESINNPVVQSVVELLQFFKKIYKTHFDMDGGPIYDACTILYLLQSELFIMVSVNIDIERQSPLTYGTMTVNLNRVAGKPVNTYFAIAVDVEEVWNLIDHKLRTYE